MNLMDPLIWKQNKRGIWSAQSAYKLIHHDDIEKRINKLNRSGQTLSIMNMNWKNNKIEKLQAKECHFLM